MPTPRPAAHAHRAALLVIAPLAVVGCGASPTDAGEAPYPPERFRFSCNTAGPTPPPAGHPFTYALEAPTQVRAGDSVRYTLTVRNVSPGVASLWTVLPGQSLNVVVRRADDRTVYDRLVADFDGTVAGVAQATPVQPGAALVYRLAWGQVGLNGRRTPPGTYQTFVTLANAWYTGTRFAEYADARSAPCSYRSEARPLTVLE
jgi:hypothetical protein